jgi:hypothetical protein
VILKSVAAGNEVTTSTTIGDPKVYGMATTAIASTAFGFIQTLGKTTLLTVDGTVDIAIGDYISHHDTAGIGQKALPGHTAIAIALEAYTTDDNSGVIDAILIPPFTLNPGTGINFGPGAVTSITVVNGLITAIS